MRIQCSWLREFVNVPGTPESLARTMSARGFAVEGIQRLGDDDAVLDFEVTANRPDCLSMVGMAREVATAYELPLQLPAEAGRPLADARHDRLAPIDVAIDSPDLCSRYVGAVADVAVAPSPDWMQARLKAAGVRPLSNVVDVTNYVLLELGQPMHAFDFSKLSGAAIRVRRAQAGESLRTLDGQSRELSPEMLVIADAERATAIAGVMGGADSEVAPATNTIVLESAYFDPRSVRRTSRTLALRTEASTRFERGADPGLAGTAMRRALELLEAIGAGQGRGAIVDCYPRRHSPLRVHLARGRIAGLLGATLPDADVRRILVSLGFALVDAGDGWDVEVPTRRVDAVRDVDLIEEIARHYGFDRLPVTFPALSSAPRPIDPRIVRTRHLRTVLTAEGFHEAVTFGFVAQAAAAPFTTDADVVAIANPLSETFAVLRPSALPGLIAAVAHNRHREQRDIRLFEIGARFSRASGEQLAVACVWTGAAAPMHWAGGARDVDLFDMKGVVERVCEAAGAPIDSTTPCGESWLVPGRAAEVHARKTRVGVLGQLSSEVASAHGLPADPVYVAEIDLDALERIGGSGHVRVEPLPKYPSVTRDISVLVDDTLAAADVRQTIRRAAPSTLVRVVEFDRYQGKGVPDFKVSLSLRLTFRSNDRTLTDAEVQESMEQVLSALSTHHGAVQR